MVVDSYVWLHELAMRHVGDLWSVSGEQYTNIVVDFLERARMLQMRNIQPLFVFDGHKRSPAKASTDRERLEKRLKNFAAVQGLIDGADGDLARARTFVRSGGGVVV